MKEFVLLLLLSNLLFALNLEQECEKEFYVYPRIENYKLRIEDKFDNYGCKLVTLYILLAQNANYDLMDLIDDKPEILEPLIQISQNPEFLKLLGSNEKFKKMVQNSEIDEDMLMRLLYLWQTEGNRLLLHEVKKNPAYLNYFILSAFYGNSDDKALQNYKRLKRKISVHHLDSFGIVVAYFTNEFYNYSFDQLLKDYLVLKNNLTKEEIYVLTEYPQYLSLFFFHNKNLESFSDYQTEMIFLYKNIFEKYKYNKNRNAIALRWVDSISPYLINQNGKINAYQFKIVFSDLIRSDLLISLLEDSEGKIDICGSKNNFTVFGKDGIVRLLNFSKIKKHLFDEFIADSKMSEAGLFTLIYTVNIYQKFNAQKWLMFETLAFSLGENIYYNISILQRLDQLNYFGIMSRCSDCNSFVKSDSEDLNSRDAKKFEYILFTSANKQNSLSILQVLYDEDEKVKQNIQKLADMPTEDLSEHIFTTGEKLEKWMDRADIALTLASVVVAPVTGGASLAYLAIAAEKKAGTFIVKKGVKVFMKKKGIKMMMKKGANKAIGQARKVRQGLYKNIGEERVKNAYKNLDKVADRVGNFTLAATVGGLLIFDKDYQPKTICEEQQ